MRIFPLRVVAVALVLSISHSASASSPRKDDAATSGAGRGDPGRSAGPTAPRVDDGKREGDAAFDDKRYDDAVVAYTRAYGSGRDPALLYNRGRAYQALGRHAQALSDFEAFKRDSSIVLLARVPALDALIAEMRAHVCRLVVTSNVKGARVILDGQDVGGTPLDEISIDAGTASLRVEADGFAPFAVTLSLLGGRTQDVAADLTAKVALHAQDEAMAIPVAPPVLTPPQRAPHADAAAPPPSRTWLYASAGAALASLGVAGVFRVIEGVQIDEENDALARHDRSAAVSWQWRAQASQSVAIASVIAGGVFAGVTAVIWVQGNTSSSTKPSVAMGLTPGGIRFDGTF